MALSRKDIMLITNKEVAFKEIEMKTEWDNHTKAGARSYWRKKHEPEAISKCPNRGRRHKKKEVPPEPQPIQEIPQNTMEIDDEICYHCHQCSDGYDFPCKHPICHPCFIKLFNENNGHMICQVCKKEYQFEDNLVDEDD